MEGKRDGGKGRGGERERGRGGEEKIKYNKRQYIKEGAGWAPS
jgi:hypothetical protein